jgi:hypothetical protein
MRGSKGLNTSNVEWYPAAEEYADERETTPNGINNQGMNAMEGVHRLSSPLPSRF